MAPPPSILGIPPDDINVKASHFIELTADNDIIFKPNPLNKSISAPQELIYTKNMVADYIIYSNLCRDAALSSSLDKTIKIRSRIPAGYTTFAEYYNECANLDCGEFTIYNAEVDCFGIVAIPVTLGHFGINQEPPSSNEHVSNTLLKNCNRKPYSKLFNAKPKNNQTLTSLLQQTRQLRGVDGLLGTCRLTIIFCIPARFPRPHGHSTLWNT